MGNLVFQATLGGQVSLVGPNTASTYNINVPAVAGNMVTTGDTGTVTNTMLAGSIANAKLANSSVTIGSTSVALGATSTTLDGVNIGATTPGTGKFTTVTDTGLTSGRVTYASTGGLLADSANMTFNGTTFTLANDASISGLTIGKGAGAVSTNTAVGASALAANTTGYYNAAGGYNALSQNTTGAGQTAFGYYALTVNTTGSENTAYGSQSLQANTTGSYNVALGRLALNSSTTGNSNTSVGYYALLNNTTASNNTAVGYQAGYSNTTCGYNVFVGYQAGYSYARTADVYGFNTFVGWGAGYNATTGVSNTFIGCQSGGYGAGNLVTTGSKNTIIGGYTGNQGGLDIRTANNYIVLSDGDGNPRAYNNVDGWVITGGGTGSTNAFVVQNATPATAFRIQNNGYINTGTLASAPYNNTTASAANMVVDSGGGISRSTSALKYKQDIRDLENISINLFRAVRYKSKCEGDDQTKDHFGVIADEVDAAGIKELVNYGADGEVEGFQYERLTVVLLKKLQTLDAEFKAYVATHP